jgi:short-subunit dehydrogenase
MSYALITGASKGIGKAIAFDLAAKGYHLLLVARSEKLLNEVKAEIGRSHPTVQVAYRSADLSTSTSAQELFDWTQQQGISISILVNNAGYGLSGRFDSHPLEQHLNMLQVNCTTLIQLTYLFLPQLKQQKEAHILNIASSAAYQAVPYLSLYAASKSLVLSFSRGLRFELRKTGVNVTCVCPGATDTDFVNRAQIGEKARKTAEKVNMTPEEVGRAAVNAMFARKAEVITGVVNKVGGFLTWLLPKKVLEGGAARIYE